jgi:hypothetical protein
MLIVKVYFRTHVNNEPAKNIFNIRYIFLCNQESHGGALLCKFYKHSVHFINTHFLNMSEVEKCIP